MPNQTTAQRTWARPGLISAALVVAMVTSTVGAARADGREKVTVTGTGDWSGLTLINNSGTGAYAIKKTESTVS